VLTRIKLTSKVKSPSAEVWFGPVQQVGRTLDQTLANAFE